MLSALGRVSFAVWSRRSRVEDLCASEAELALVAPFTRSLQLRDFGCDALFRELCSDAAVCAQMSDAELAARKKTQGRRQRFVVCRSRTTVRASLCITSAGGRYLALPRNAIIAGLWGAFFTSLGREDNNLLARYSNKFLKLQPRLPRVILQAALLRASPSLRHDVERAAGGRRVGDVPPTILEEQRVRDERWQRWDVVASLDVLSDGNALATLVYAWPFEPTAGFSPSQQEGLMNVRCAPALVAAQMLARLHNPLANGAVVDAALFRRVEATLHLATAFPRRPRDAREGLTECREDIRQLAMLTYGCRADVKSATAVLDTVESAMRSARLYCGVSSELATRADRAKELLRLQTRRLGDALSVLVPHDMDDRRARGSLEYRTDYHYRLSPIGCHRRGVPLRHSCTIGVLALVAERRFEELAMLCRMVSNHCNFMPVIRLVPSTEADAFLNMVAVIDRRLRADLRGQFMLCRMNSAGCAGASSAFYAFVQTPTRTTS